MQPFSSLVSRHFGFLEELDFQRHVPYPVQVDFEGERVWVTITLERIEVVVKLYPVSVGRLLDLPQPADLRWDPARESKEENTRRRESWGKDRIRISKQYGIWLELVARKCLPGFIRPTPSIPEFEADREGTVDRQLGVYADILRNHYRDLLIGDLEPWLGGPFSFYSQVDV